MRRRAVRFELRRVCTAQRLPLVTKGSCRRRRLKGSERRRFAEHPPAVVQQNVHFLIPSGFAALTHRLAAARSRRGPDSPPGCHSTPRRRFAALVTKGRLWYRRNAQQLKNKNASPHQSASPTALPKAEPRDLRKLLLPQKYGGRGFAPPARHIFTKTVLCPICARTPRR